jgi:hypothetical protein
MTEGMEGGVAPGEVVGGVAGEVAQQVVGEVVPTVVPDGSGGATPAATPGETELTAEDERQVNLFRMYRARMHDVPDDRFERLLEGLRDRQSVRSLARGLVEDGYCAYLKPKTVVIYVMRIRDALGLPGYVEQQAEIDRITKEGEPDEPIEGQPALKRLQWLTRTQHARVRKALRMEGMMGGMVLPQASSEIKLLEDLLDKELTIALKTGEMKEAPKTVKFDTTGLPVKTPSEAFRVLLAFRRAQKLAEKMGGGESRGADARPALPSTGGEASVVADGGDGRPEGSAAVAAEVPAGNPDARHVGSGHGGDGGDGRPAPVGE